MRGWGGGLRWWVGGWAKGLPPRRSVGDAMRAVNAEKWDSANIVGMRDYSGLTPWFPAAGASSC